MVVTWDFENENIADHASLLDVRMRAVANAGVNWPIGKRKGVANYLRKVLTPMTRGELSLVFPNDLQELVDHAAAGYDRFIARRRR